MSSIAKPPSKSQRTRAAILVAARDLFARTGYDRTTVRDIAAEAKADPALVIRYFGSKGALFASAVEIDLRLPNFAAAPRRALGRSIAAHFVALWEDQRTGDPLKILLRTASVNEEASAKIAEIFVTQVVPALGKGAIAKERAALVTSLLLGVALARYVLKLPPLASMKPADLTDLLASALGASLLTRHSSQLAREA
jgi:AcrR family transcriptional regulator